ncbi:MAG TPA: FTR1 family protein [Ramlibacter sp.]|uniref:FTR1 family protein n=1 Tax=Ramlibacter sp. TaxID=1917967 RepID=UPI002D80FD8E|nr:FTR1 family protein [Ramlibacter sp.]HET8746864.1 FTR1 family protein [Ramlibacter sp.]
MNLRGAFLRWLRLLLVAAGAGLPRADFAAQGEQQIARPAEIVLARTLLREAVWAYVRHDVALARNQVGAAREALRPLAARVEASDAGLRHEIRRELRALAAAIDTHQRAGTVAAHATRVERLLDRAAERLERDARTAAALYVSALLVPLREGIGAVLVLAALAAMVRRSGQAAAMDPLHAGWMAAVLLTLATWFAAGPFVESGGADWEVTEGVTTLLAAAMLLYVVFGLPRRSSPLARETLLPDGSNGAVERRTAWALAGVAFLALYRELFEIVILLQVLWAHASASGRSAIAGGVASAAVLLAALAWAIVRFSGALPFARLQAATSVLLAAIALVFVGHGISELQDAQLLPASAVRFAMLPALGLHPTAQGLAAQGLVAGLGLAVLLHHRRRRH